jgi:hypothetical protein
MESQVWYAEPAVELNLPARGSDASLCGLMCAVGVNPLARGSDARLRGRERRNYSTTISHRRSLRRRLQGQVFGKPLHSFSRFGLQDAQTPPSPRVGEGGWGDEGQTGAATEWSSSRDDRVSGAPSPVAGISPGARRRRAHPGHLRFQRQVFWQAPACHLPFQAAERPDAPFSPCGRRGMLTGVGFFGKPLHSFSHSGLQDAQTPPSPLVGEGGRGDEGANAHGNVDLPPSPHHQWQVDLPRWRQHQRYGGCDRRR